MVGFTCYLWNIERTLWIAERLKQRRPELIVLLGGPEITADNAWVLAESGGRLRRVGRRGADVRRVAGGACGEADRNVCSRKSSSWPLPTDRRRPDADMARSRRHLVALRRRHSRPGRRAADVAGNGARLPLPLQVLLLSEEPRRASLPFGRADSRQSELCRRARGDGSRAARSDAQPAARFRRLSAAASPRQSRRPAGVFRRIAGRRDRRRAGPAAPRGQFPRGRDRSAIGRAARRGN